MSTLPRSLRSRSALLAAVLFVGAVSVGLAPSADGDIWWHLAAGREMVARGQLLFSDPFSVSASGRPWPDVHWLFQLTTYAVHSAFGLAGLVWAKCLIVACGALLLFFSLERKPGSWQRPLFVTSLLLALFAARSLLLLRPVIASLFFLALFLYELERFRRDGRTRHLLVLPLAQVLWANFQGLSALGPAVVGAYAAGAGLTLVLGGRSAWFFAPESARPGARDFRAQALTLGGCGAALVLTPFGLLGLALPAKLLGRLLPGAHNVYAQNVAENVPPFLLERFSHGEFWHLKWFFAALAVAVACGGRRLRSSHVLLVAGFAVLALMSNRNVLLFYWVATPIAVGYLAPVLRARLLRWNARAGQRAAWLVNAAVLVALLSGSAVAAARESALGEPSPFRVPAQSARLLASLPSGDIFSADHHGGYLIWQLFPRFRPYIDTRLVLRSPEEFAAYLRLADEPERFDAFQAQHRFSYVVLPVDYPDRYLGLIAHLYASRDWKLLYSNGSEVLFARRDIASEPAWSLGSPALTTRTISDMTREFAASTKSLAAARLHLAMLDIAVGEFAQAEHVLSLTAGPEAEALTARCRVAAGDIAGAQQIGERLLKQDQNDVSTLNLMAQIALRRGEPAEGVRFLRRALRSDPFDGEASQLLANLEANQ
jgi:tetratricopeptide (TPR) repeat protein